VVRCIKIKTLCTPSKSKQKKEEEIAFNSLSLRFNSYTSTSAFAKKIKEHTVLFLLILLLKSEVAISGAITLPGTGIKVKLF